ncbi:hypothetical protein [Sphingomonas kyeonggiensis]|uniref:Uncharacterized protein n=1 Tax=Sphingomonas kyeonggiensis TaxID=1268553 RepID=A0A7W6NVT9_9SPHN|nr:hypothetical protein [Sphingomonas kyeonggiensis]MBB4098434.1 hypothetical protein [Sphingomonas kyeonggiensis]
MPPVRIAALVALGLAVFLALLWFVPRDAGYADQICLAALLVAAANAAMVARLGRSPRTGLQGSALWLVMVGVGAAIAFGSFADWVGLVVPDDGSLMGFVAVAGSIATVLFWTGPSALAAGWLLWFASRRVKRVRLA